MRERQYTKLNREIVSFIQFLHFKKGFKKKTLSRIIQAEYQTSLGLVYWHLNRDPHKYKTLSAQERKKRKTHKERWGEIILNMRDHENKTTLVIAHELGFSLKKVNRYLCDTLERKEKQRIDQIIQSESSIRP